MIGRLRGIVISKSQGELLIDVGGVGYYVHCSDRTLSAISPIGQQAIIYTDLVVREDLMQLFGFESVQERAWYQLLVSVQGVGSKAALAILGTLGTDALGRALTLEDINSVRAAPGIGPKLAQRICNELKEKSAKLMATMPNDEEVVIDENDAQDLRAQEVQSPNPQTTQASLKKREPSQTAPINYSSEAISALTNLGYDHVLAAQTVTRLYDDSKDLNDLITNALRSLAPKG